MPCPNKIHIKKTHVENGNLKVAMVKPLEMLKSCHGRCMLKIIMAVMILMFCIIFVAMNANKVAMVAQKKVICCHFLQKKIHAL